MNLVNGWPLFQAVRNELKHLEGSNSDLRMKPLPFFKKMFPLSSVTAYPIDICRLRFTSNCWTTSNSSKLGNSKFSYSQFSAMESKRNRNTIWISYMNIKAFSTSSELDFIAENPLKCLIKTNGLYRSITKTLLSKS